MRWVFLDKILELKKGRLARTLSRMPAAGGPSPQALLIEMMAQTAGLLAGAETSFEKDVIFAKIEKVFFENLPPEKEEIVIEALPDQAGENGGWFEASVSRGGEPFAKGRLLLMNAGRLVPEREGSVTFHRAFMEHYRVYDHLRGES